MHFKTSAKSWVCMVTDNDLKSLQLILSLSEDVLESSINRDSVGYNLHFQIDRLYYVEDVALDQSPKYDEVVSILLLLLISI